MAFAFDGFFLRGGLAVGDVYVDSTIVYGKAFLDAVEAEKKVNWPRIVFAPSAIEYIHKYLGYYGSVESAPANRHIFIDEDGEWVLDYLEDVWQDRTGCEEYVLDVRSFSLKRLEDDEEVLRRHRDRR